MLPIFGKGLIKTAPFSKEKDDLQCEDTLVAKIVEISGSQIIAKPCKKQLHIGERRSL